MYIAMLDLETLSTRPDAAVPAIALVVRELGNRYAPIETWCGRIDPDLMQGFRDSETIKWWDQQDAVVRRYVFGGLDNPREVLQGLNAWLKDIVGDPGEPSRLQLYADPATFDFPILKMQYAYANVPMLWTFRQENCLRQVKRTMLKIGVPPPEVQATVPHDPRSDALAQMEELMDCQAKLSIVKDQLP